MFWVQPYLNFILRQHTVRNYFRWYHFCTLRASGWAVSFMRYTGQNFILQNVEVGALFTFWTVFHDCFIYFYRRPSCRIGQWVDITGLDNKYFRSHGQGQGHRSCNGTTFRLSLIVLLLRWKLAVWCEKQETVWSFSFWLFHPAFLLDTMWIRNKGMRMCVCGYRELTIWEFQQKVTRKSKRNIIFLCSWSGNKAAEYSDRWEFSWGPSPWFASSVSANNETSLTCASMVLYSPYDMWKYVLDMLCSDASRPFGY